jgi:hypothetical protein
MAVLACGCSPIAELMCSGSTLWNQLIPVTPSSRDKQRARVQFMALLLNVASGRLAVCNCLEDRREVSDVIAEVDSLLSGDPHFHTCEHARTLADEINNGASIVPCDTAWTQVPAEAVQPPSISATPNPFSNSTAIKYEVKTPGPVRLEIYDISGRLVETLVNETQEPGIHQVRWNREANPSGVYFYRLEACPERSPEPGEGQSRRAGESVETRKMVVVE